LVLLGDICFLYGQFGAFPSIVELTLVYAVSLCGMGCTLCFRSGWRSLAKDAVVSATIFGLLLVTALFAISDVVPTVGDVPQMTERDRQRILKELKRISEDDRQSARLVLAEKDLDLIAARWLRALSSSALVDVRIGDGVLWAEATVACPRICLGHRYLNFELHFSQTGNATAPDEIVLSAFRVGGIEMPRTWAVAASRAVFVALREHSQSGPYFANILECHFRANFLELRGNLQRNLGRPLTPLDVGLNRDESLTKSVLRYCDGLELVADSTPPGDERFLGLLAAAFRAAHERTLQDVTGAAAENRAALIAFGVVVGNPSLKSVAGLTAPQDFRGRHNRRVSGVTLRGRNDWARHFAASAALALLSSEPLGRTAGVLKEEFDAGKHGSGFSFADLLADDAGIRLAMTATRDEASAVRIQQQLTAGSSKIDDLFPSPDGLPEGISARQLEERLGGVGGTGYQVVEQDLARRLEKCALLR
jgi:hypothetical protein